MNRPPDPQFIAFVQKRDEKFSTKACCLKRKKALMLCFYGFDTEYEQTLPETSKEKRLSNALDRKLDAGEWIVVRPQYTYLSASPPPPENYLPFFKDQSVFYTLAGLMSAPVTDENYGKGIITACDESTVTAVFESVGEKVLPFPEAFEESTAFASAELNAMMWYYLARTRSQRLINERHENDRLRYDPIEKTRYFTYANPYAAQLAEESIGLPSDWFINFGEGFTLELAKESILKERFGIIWRTVTDMNPDVCFD